MTFFDPHATHPFTNAVGPMSERSDVVVTDIQMAFGSMVVFMVKWAIASVPAVIILMLVGGLAAGFVGGAIGVFGR